MIHSNNSLVKSFFHTNLFKPIYDHYSPMGFCGTTYELCTLKELTYQQWINQLVLLNPPPSMNMIGTNESYVRAFPSWTVLSFTPELGYYLGKAELPQFQVNVSDVLSFMQPNRLFNQEIIGDIMVNKTIKSYSPVFTNPQMAQYLRFIIIEAGLNGIFQYRTPREYIEGFIDPTVYQMSQQPVYQGGDQTNDPFMSINNSPAYPKNNSMAFFTGTDDSAYTRRVARWLDQTYISMKRLDYDSVSQLSYRY